MCSKALAMDDSENFKILVATDIHLGFEEKNLIRGKKLWSYSFIRIIIIIITMAIEKNSQYLITLYLCLYINNI
jgi:metallophosphoesterase superfamily enzyme